jgi:PAS domain S-box-containing protein
MGCHIQGDSMSNLLVHKLTDDTAQSKRSTQEVRRRANELEVIAQVSAAATQILDGATLLQTVVNLAQERFDLYHAHVYLVDRTGENLYLAAGAGEIGETMSNEGHTISVTEEHSLVARAARTRQGITINDVTSEPGFLHIERLPNTRAKLALPMIVGDTLLGILAFHADTVGRFSEEDIQIKTILAQQIAIALRNVRAFEQQQRQIQLNEASAHIAEYLRRSVNSTEDMLDSVLATMIDVFHADNAVVSRYDTVNNMWYGVTGTGTAMTREIAKSFIDPGEHYPHALEALRTNQVVVVEHANRYPNFPPEYLDEKVGIKSVLVLPLAVDNHIDGILVVNFTSGYRVFSNDELNFARLIDDQISVGLERRIQEEQVNIERERAELTARDLEAVSEVSTAITNIHDPEQLLSEVVELTKSRFDLYHAHIYLLDETGDQLILAAGAGTPGRIMKERGHRIAISHPNSIVARAAREQQTVLVNDVTTSPTFLPNPLLPNTRSEVAAPMVANGQLIGVLDVQADIPNKFSEIDSKTKTTLASQIAVAVINARAFAALIKAESERARAEEQMRRRASELETVATVSTAITTMLDQDELLQTVVELTKTNFDLYHAHVYLFDADRQYLLLAAGAGEAGVVMKARGHRIAAAHPNSLVARAARTGVGVVSNDVSKQVDFLPNPLLPETRSEMALPMIANEQVIGVLDVQSQILDRFTEDDVLVQTTLSAQIAVAVQNVRAVERIKLTERAIENSTSGMTIADARLPDMPLVYVNHAFEVITGYTPEEAIGKNCRFLQSDDRDQEALMELRAAIKEHRQTTVILRNYRKDGTLFWNELRLSPIFNARGEITHFVGVQTDITERREIEIERENIFRLTEEQAQKDRETAERLRDVDRLKSQFLANMSHELRTPLNSIIGYSELLLDGDDGELTEEAHEDVSTIHSSGQHLLSLINEILDLAKIEAGQMSVDRKSIDIGTISAEVIQTAQVLVKSKPVTLVIKEETPIPVVFADPIRLRQIITNLVGNGIKFTEEGSVTVAYGLESPQQMYVEVRDTGMGMSKNDLGVIFQQFRQVDGSTTRRAGGTGLGLTISKALVELHGGSISVDSEINVGTTFRFTLPLHVAEAAPIS